MNAMQVAERYFDAWNRRDADAIVASFASGGTYSDPSAGENLQGEAIAAYAKGLWSAFPDLSFETVSVADDGAGTRRGAVDHARNQYRFDVAACRRLGAA